jgi:hypothetical protein
MNNKRAGAFLRLLGSVALIVGGLTWSATSLATYVFYKFDYPGAANTAATGINDSGQVAGVYGTFPDWTGFMYVPDPNAAGGLFGQLPALPAGYTTGWVTISSAGTVVGYAVTAASKAASFILRAGAYDLIGDAAPAYTDPRLINISPGGLAVGSATTAAGRAALIYDPGSGTGTTFTVPGYAFTALEGMNGSGASVGTVRLGPASVNGNAFGFVRDAAGNVTPFQLGGANTYAHAINDAGIVAGEFGFDGVGQGFVGTLAGWQLLSVPGAVYTAVQSINNAGQIVGQYALADGVLHSFVGTPASLPAATASGSYSFDVAISGAPIFIDPVIAVGYDYAIGKRNPNFATVRLPVGIGDSLYVVSFGKQSHIVAGGERFDFRTHGAPDGVKKFRVSDIDVSAALDPLDPAAFPTELTFVANGRFTGTMTPVKTCVAAPAASAPKESAKSKCK